MPLELSVVIPTYNEKDNIRPLLDTIDAALQGIAWEVIFVDDDSPDGTSEYVRQIACNDPRIRLLQRMGRRGLSAACIEGMLSSSAPYMAVMDADLQHDAALLAAMFEALHNGGLDLVVGSRYIKGGAFGQFSPKRALMSRFATWLGRAVIRIDLKDPMSGYFMLTRPFFNHVVRRLSGRGFKILLDICASSLQKIRFKELPFNFGQRLSGSSKLDHMVLYDYLRLIIDKIPARFFKERP